MSSPAKEMHQARGAVIPRIFRVLLILFVMACTAWQATAGPVGPEFQVNTYRKKSQRLPAVAALGNGGFVVCWESEAQDGSFSGVYAQRYSVNGEPKGNEFRVNRTTANSQWLPSVAGLSNGGFVVIWQSFGQDGSGVGIYGQRYTAKGERLGREFRVNTRTRDDQVTPSVAGLSDGDFVVTWMSAKLNIHAQRYSASGAQIGTEFRVNTTTKLRHFSPSVAGLAEGGFVVTWYKAISAAINQWNVYGQRYRANGNRVGQEFQVNTTKRNAQVTPSVAALGDGGFIVIWVSVGQDGSGDGVYGQRYDADGSRVGPEFRVNTYSEGSQLEPSVAGLEDGGFVAVWQSENQDGSQFGIFGKRYSDTGDEVGGEFQVNTHIESIQSAPAIAGLSGGGFVAVWESWEQDGSKSGVFGQRFE